MGFYVLQTMLENHKPIFLFLGLAGVIPAILFRGKSPDKTEVADSAKNQQSVDTSIKTNAESNSTKPVDTRRRSKASLDVESISNRNS